MKHTPGPWDVCGDVDITGPQGEFVATAHVPGSEVGTAREYANARLIAAAPDLLEALRMAAGFIESGESAGHSFFEVRQAWRNAIAKVQS